MGKPAEKLYDLRYFMALLNAIPKNIPWEERSKIAAGIVDGNRERREQEAAQVAPEESLIELEEDIAPLE